MQVTRGALVDKGLNLLLVCLSSSINKYFVYPQKKKVCEGDNGSRRKRPREHQKSNKSQIQLKIPVLLASYHREYQLGVQDLGGEEVVSKQYEVIRRVADEIRADPNGNIFTLDVEIESQGFFEGRDRVVIIKVTGIKKTKDHYSH